MQKKHLGLALELKETKTTDEFVYIEGYGSYYGNVDRGNDVVVSGAFKESLAMMPLDDNRKVLFLLDHDWKQVIGKWDEVYEKDDGLYVKGRLPNTPDNQTFISKVKMGAYQGFSIGYNTVETRWDDTTGVRYITKAELYEVSLVSIPMNGKATIEDVKAMYNRINDATNLKDLHKAIQENTGGLSHKNFNALVSKVKEFSNGTRNDVPENSTEDSNARNDAIVKADELKSILGIGCNEDNVSKITDLLND